MTAGIQSHRQPGHTDDLVTGKGKGSFPVWLSHYFTVKHRQPSSVEKA